MVTLQTWFLWFVLYSVIGWLWEIIVCSVAARRFTNRGFLNGPYCPIYGVGALLCVAVLGDVQNPVLLFLGGAVLTCTLEYITSWVMEKLFHARWWDYSQNRFNLNGRISLLGAVAFGALSLIVLKLLHPAVMRLTALLSREATEWIALVLFTGMLVDLVYTLARLSDFGTKLRALSEKINAALAAAQQQNEASEAESKPGTGWAGRLSESYADWQRRFNRQERRILKAFPKMKSSRYDEALQWLRHKLSRRNPEDESNGDQDNEN